MGGGIHPPLEILHEWSKVANPSSPSETRGWGLAILCIVIFALTFGIVIARLWARFKVRRTAGIDDALIVAALVPTVGLAISTALASRIYGFGRHAWDLTPEMAVQSRKITLAMEATYIVSTGLTKISILLFYRRMTDGSISVLSRRIANLSIASVVAYMVAFILVGFLGCSPYDAFWLQVDINWAIAHPKGDAYNCIDEGAMLLASCAISMVQDLLACGLPLPLFWKLRLPKRQRIALAAIFSVGFFLCITGCLRTYYVYRIFYTTYDVTWAAWDVWVWTVVEAHLAIICSSAPALKIFFKRYLSSLTSLASSAAFSRKRRSYAPKATASSGEDRSRLGTTSTANLDGGQRKEYELGGISVTKEVEIDSKSGYGVDENESRRPSHSDEEHSPDSPERKSRSPWLYVDPPKNPHYEL